MTDGSGHGQLADWHGRPWFAANEVLAFVLEVVVIGALAWWGFTVRDGTLVSAVLGIGVPAVAVALWGLFAAPRARFRVPVAVVLVVKAVVLGGGAGAVYGTGRPVTATVLAVVLVVNTGCAEYFRRARRAAGAPAGAGPGS
ncbi:YrdB family protein [Streptomyces sp. NBC_01754]|uniref:YrdB family protein n=1 Tax=Streptomyces sp. NBC_01754 TaxID=2975930 RepID=UPI002DDB54D2|nr:YrdB family protein [Streptomyces sp. NBC_01754]WSC94515.1 YrdB family protein [Streptomyces sp. NBC_01754]